MKTQHALEVPSGYLLFVEGVSDIDYLRKAAELVNDQFGFDLLALDGKQRSAGELTICSPKNPAYPGEHRGGTPQLCRLADDIRQHVLWYQVPSPVCFLFDHDKAGLEAAQSVRKMGLDTDTCGPLTLDPSLYVRACKGAGGERVVEVEDLIDCGLHRQFFDGGLHDCTVWYVNGKSTRYEWREASKEQFRRFVMDNARWDQVRELIRVLVRVRQLWRLETPSQILALPDP